ncbi:GAF domain-containing protein [Oceanidesulfovibrio marinus]|uniref:GAF domain-containing protein n=1 Tax=Oceanidesulfovibrio marinus TaxID=370038 RepID=A0ABX6NK19_9BACT|nr:GAF domain-containing protein [Oceanidesulfovibrio marinus]QJT09985.1 GAF domain-containing protein [Oceanidesulfovibrio marinus]
MRSLHEGIKERYENAKHHVVRFASNIQTIKLVAQIAITIVSPIVFSLYVGQLITADLKVENISVWWTISFGLVLGVHIASAVFLYFIAEYNTAKDFAFYEKALTKVNYYERYHEEVSNFHMALRKVNLNAKSLSLRLVSVEDLKSDKTYLDTLLDPIKPCLCEIFNYNRSAHMNFAVFLANEEERKLECVYRYRSMKLERIKKDMPSRSWPYGVGHVGACFVDGDPIAIDDLTTFGYYSKNKKDDDDKFYRAAMSVPLCQTTALALSDGYKDDIKPVGVIILTSSHPGQFTKYHLAMLELLKNQVEMVISNETVQG